MKRIFTSHDSAEVGLLKNMLEDAGIQCLIQNETQPYQSVFQPELWVLNDEDAPKAVDLREAWRHPEAAVTGPWTCTGCGEVLEGQFISCWKCGTKRTEGTV